MKKKIIIWGTIPLLLIGFVIVNGNYILQSIEWKLNWDFKVPRTSEIETVFYTRNGFPSEGQTFRVLHYHSIKKKLNEKDGWIPINEESFEMVTKHLQTFQKNVVSINKDTQILNELIQENPVPYENGDYYFYKLKDDNSYILAISNVKEQKIYVMEWIQ